MDHRNQEAERAEKKKTPAAIWDDRGRSTTSWSYTRDRFSCCVPERIPGDSDPSLLQKLVTHALDESFSPTFDRLLKAAPVSEDLRHTNLHRSVIEPQDTFVVTATQDQTSDLFGDGFDETRGAIVCNCRWPSLTMQAVRLSRLISQC